MSYQSDLVERFYRKRDTSKTAASLNRSRLNMAGWRHGLSYIILKDALKADGCSIKCPRQKLDKTGSQDIR